MHGHSSAHASCFGREIRELIVIYLTICKICVEVFASGGIIEKNVALRPAGLC